MLFGTGEATTDVFRVPCRWHEEELRRCWRQRVPRSEASVGRIFSNIFIQKTHGFRECTFEQFVDAYLTTNYTSRLSIFPIVDDEIFTSIIQTWLSIILWSRPTRTKHRRSRLSVCLIELSQFLKASPIYGRTVVLLGPPNRVGRVRENIRSEFIRRKMTRLHPTADRKRSETIMQNLSGFFKRFTFYVNRNN